jgi:hypothetical protein
VDLIFLSMVLWRYRLNVEQAEWIIYVTDVGQQQHFDMFFSVSTEWHQGVFHLLCIYLNLLPSFYRLQRWPVGSQIQAKRSFRKQAMLDLVLFLVQMASVSEPAVLRLFDW